MKRPGHATLGPNVFPEFTGFLRKCIKVLLYYLVVFCGIVTQNRFM